MRNLILRTLSGLVLVWILLEATASGNLWYYIVWGVVCGWSIVELLGLIWCSKVLRHKAVWMVTGVLYICVGAWVLWQLQDRWQLLVMMLTMVWANDVGAYITGRTMGRHRMMPRISPNKTWEGFCGGLVFAAATALLWYRIGPMANDVMPVLVGISAWSWAMCGVGVGVAAVLGDMVESVLKRRLGVKDSGRAIPGHGGMLDRFDATFMALPIFYAILYYI